MLQRDIFSVV